MTEEQQAKLPSGQVVKWKDEDFPFIYSNIIGFGMSGFDIYLQFGQLGESTPVEVNAIPKVRVILSPEQAANVVKLLTVAVETYIANNGQLRTVGAVNVDDINTQLKTLKLKVESTK
jgi:hypothetical protein